MSETEQKTIKNYPIFKIEIPDKCNAPGVCDLSEFNLKVVGIKTVPESYILQYHCDDKQMLLSLFTGLNMPLCEENKFPLDAFIIDKTGMDTGNMEKNLETYQEEEMPATDVYHIAVEASPITDYGQFVHGFSYTDESIGYKLIPITNENREEIYAEFLKKKFNYQASESAMEKFVNQYISMQELVNLSSEENCAAEVSVSSESELQNNQQDSSVEVSSSPQQSWFENILGSVMSFFHLEFNV